MTRKKNPGVRRVGTANQVTIDMEGNPFATDPKRFGEPGSANRDPGYEEVRGIAQAGSQERWRRIVDDQRGHAEQDYLEALRAADLMAIRGELEEVVGNLVQSEHAMQHFDPKRFAQGFVREYLEGDEEKVDTVAGVVSKCVVHINMQRTG